MPRVSGMLCGPSTARSGRLRPTGRLSASFHGVREARSYESPSAPALEEVVHHERHDRSKFRGEAELCFAEIISADRVKTYKPSPRVYALGPEILTLPPAEILFVSSNLWDAAGAKAFGYPVCWCNRSGAEVEDWGFAPDFTVLRLDRVAETFLA